MAPLILPISRNEFAHHLKQCTPPTGWQKSIAVAHSAGADSTCLLFLIRQLVGTPGLPRMVHSFYVNHGFQAANKEMEDVARRTSTRLGATPHTLPIPWSTPPFPPKPSEDVPSEAIARDARYRVLFDGMREAGARIVAFGQHADDQAETAMMRWALGSTALGLAGTRRIRRWGMGSGRSEEDVDYYGLEGMNMWVIRPLLSFGKDRILATCEANGLAYVEDPTNFQPQHTLRNEIRGYLSRLRDQPSPGDIERNPQAAISAPSPTVKAALIHRLQSVQKNVSKRPQLPLELHGNIHDMHHSIRELEFRFNDIETQVSAALARTTVHSPPGTILLASGAHLSSINLELVRQALILRVLRAVSPEPWGSLASQANRRTDSIQRIAERLFTPFDKLPKEKRRPFMAGAFVSWQPLRICADGSLKHFIEPDFRNKDGVDEFGMKAGDRAGWMAVRAKPPSWIRGPVDISSSIVDAHDQWSQQSQPDPDAIHEVLWDNRFTIRIRLARAPETLFDNLRYGARVLVIPEGAWWWPRVVLVQPHKKEVLLARIGAQPMQWLPDFARLRGMLGMTEEVQDVEGKSFMDFKFARPLDAL
ncbi:unnamed protein product [Peniophora sp. CBMAI 1063]|nr:unnamed protein product [Peniophora sp. CBMAI 1063]